MDIEKYRIRWIFNTNSWKPTEEEWEKCLLQLPKPESERIKKYVIIIYAIIHSSQLINK